MWYSCISGIVITCIVITRLPAMWAQFSVLFRISFRALFNPSIFRGATALLVATVKVTGSLHADTRAVYLIKRYFIVFLSPKIKPCDPTWTWKTVLK